MIIRTASELDYATMNRLYQEVDALHAQARPDVYCSSPTPGRSWGFLESQRRAADGEVFVAETEPRGETSVDVIGQGRARVVGFANVKLGSAAKMPILRPRGFAYLEELVVSSECRRRGVGTALLRKVEDWARARQVDALELVVWEFNEDAVKFYEALGYVVSYRRMSKSLTG